MAKSSAVTSPAAKLQAAKSPLADQAEPAEAGSTGTARAQPAPAAPVPEALPGFEDLAPPRPAPVPAAQAEPRPARPSPGKAKAAAKAIEAAAVPGPASVGDIPSDPARDTAPVPTPPPVLPSIRTGALQATRLTDGALVTRGRLVLADPVRLNGTPAESGRSVRTSAAATLPPLYPPMSFVTGTEPLFDPRLAPLDALDVVPLALNSVDALRQGVPVGPFRAGLIEDTPGGPPRIETGTVVWQVEGDPAVMAEKGPLAIRAVATIGKAPMRFTLSLRNEAAADGAGPLSLDLSAEIPGDAILQAGIPEMRNSGIDRGVALYASLAAGGPPVRFAFAANATDGEQNVKMLSSRSWIDIPVRLRSGRKVVIALEKGTAVRDIMRESFRLWRLPWLP